jgi:Nucleotidyl transferase AbiEii toxin, Type IV TA system
MHLIAELSAKDRSELFTETASQKGMTTSVVEKDFWVTWTLSKLFGSSELGEMLRFKGGTTLSKVYGIIERFSEDIDLILNWKILTEKDPEKARSGKKQKLLNDEIREAGRQYIQFHLTPLIASLMAPTCTCENDPSDRNVVNIYYPKSFSDKYIRPEIRLEIGPLASWLPCETFKIRSFAAEVFPGLFSRADCSVHVIKAERTFWEKATILHHEAHRPLGSMQPPRNSRHYYDLALLAKSPIKDRALADLHILTSVVEFKKKFYSRGWANYDLAKPGTFRLLPEEHVLEAVKKDYKEMRSMIYGTYYDYSVIHSILSELEVEINSL